MNTDVVQPELDTAAPAPAMSVASVHPPERAAARPWPASAGVTAASIPQAATPRAATATPRPLRGRPPILVSIGLLCLTVAIAAGLLVMHLREIALTEAEHEFARLSQVLADQAEQALEAIDLLQTDLLERLKDNQVQTADQFRDAMSTYAVHEDLRKRVVALSQLETISALDADGKLINLSRSWPVPDLRSSDRDFFRVLKANPDQTSFIGKPIPSRIITNSWMMPVSRKVTGPDNTFIGLILGGVQLNYFEQRYKAASRMNGMALALFHQDGTLMVRYPHADPRIGTNFATSGIFDRLKDSPDGSLVTRQPGQIEHADRLIAARLVPRHPMAVTVSAPVSLLLADWRRQATYLVGTAALLELMIALAGLLMMRHLRGQQMLHDAQAARAEAEAARRGAETSLLLAREQERIDRELHIQNRRFEAALDNMTQALVMFDASDTLIVTNRRLTDMFGVPSDSIFPGMGIEAALRMLDGASKLSPADTQSMRRSLRQFRIDRTATARLRELEDGRTLAVNYVPVEDDGWLVTFEDITERRHVAAKITHMAHHDALTGLPNRVLFHEKLTEAVARGRRGEPCALLFLDLDHFKAVNDTLGHPAGDALLQEVTKRLTSQVRELDTVARLGGDEFAIVQSSVDQPVDATTLATRIIEILSVPYNLDGQQVILGTSVGIALVPDDGEDPDQLLKNADMALYRAKAEGRGRYRFFEPAMDAAMQGRRTLELDLRKALAEGQFRVFYQPLMSVKARSLTGFEALVRWQHPERGMVPPDDFIPLAEETGLIVPLGEWVLRQACLDAVGWPGTPKVAVNLSPVQFTSRTLVQDVAAALATSGLDPSRLELEITETVMLADTDTILVILHQLRDLGVGIAMDDFGTGYSSLSYLRRFPFSKVKIDRSFVAGMGQRGDCDTIIEAVADLCKRLGMITTAEGVETDDQFTRLAQGECTEAQGYLFSKPRPANEVAALCARLTRPGLLPSAPPKSAPPSPPSSSPPPSSPPPSSPPSSSPPPPHPISQTAAQPALAASSP